MYRNNKRKKKPTDGAFMICPHPECVRIFTFPSSYRSHIRHRLDHSTFSFNFSKDNPTLKLDAPTHPEAILIREKVRLLVTPYVPQPIGQLKDDSLYNEPISTAMDLEPDSLSNDVENTNLEEGHESQMADDGGQEGQEVDLDDVSAAGISHNSQTKKDFIVDWLEEIYAKAGRKVQKGDLQRDSTLESIIPYDLTLLHMFLEDPTNEPDFQLPPNLDSEIELMEMFNPRDGGVPKYLFNNVIDFLKKHVVPDVSRSSYHHFRPREMVMKDILFLSHMNSQMPTEEEVFLPNLGETVKCTTFDIYAVLYDLLTAPNLDKDENYLFHGPIPVCNPEKEPAWINDIDTGQRYIQSWYKLKQHPLTLPLGWITSLDKTQLNPSNDRLSLEALMVQLSLH